MLYLTADPHLDTEGTNMLGRPFSSKEEMNGTILEEYNSRAGKNDRIIIAGDFSFREPQKWRNKLRCKNIVLVLGNHDPVRRCVLAFGQNNVREQYMTKCCGHNMFISHYPTLYWPKSHYGSFHGYGHVHDMRTDTIMSHFPDIRAIDLGVHSGKRILGKWTLFSEEEIYEILIKRKGHDPVEFYKELRGEYKKDHNPEH